MGLMGWDKEAEAALIFVAYILNFGYVCDEVVVKD
jgi:hypothetical protein